MIKRYTKVIVIILIIAILVAIPHFITTPLNDIILSHVNLQDVDSINIEVIFTPHGTKEFNLQEQINVNDFVGFFDDIKVRKNLFSKTFHPKSLDHYLIHLLNENGDTLEIIEVMDKNNIYINGKTYSIASDVDFNNLYKLAIKEYDGNNKDFYFSLIH